jgi:glycosyltransferase involved in cell wall biosynthesis
MKILFDVREASRNVTGIGTYVRNIAREVRAHGDPQIVCRCVPERTESPAGKAVRSLPVQAINFLRNVTWKQAYLPARAHREKADVLVCMDPLGPLVCPTLTALTIYDMIFLTSGAQTDAWTRYWRVMVPRCARRADLLFTLSQTSRAQIVTRLGVPAEKIVVIRSGIAGHFHPLRGSAEEQERVRHRLGLPQSYLLMVGAHDPRRNLKTLFAAYQRLKAKGSLEQKLVIVGQRTPYFQEVRDTARTLGIEEDVLFRDYVSNEDLRCYYGLADLYVYPSLEEGFGFTPLEAMACGLPVVASRATSLPEVLGDAAVMVNPTDPDELAGAIDQALSDQDLRRSLIQKGLSRARDFSWSAGLEDIVKACVRLVERSATPAGARKRAKAEGQRDSR